MRGFTIVELTLVIAIVFVLAVFIFPISNEFLERQKLQEVERSLTASLRSAERFAQEGQGSRAYGVRLLTDAFVRFEGDSYETRNNDEDQIYSLSGSIVIDGPEEVIFREGERSPIVEGETLLSSVVYSLQINSISEEIILYENGLVSK